MAVFEFEAELWEYHGDASWHFVTLPHDVSDEIDELFPRKAGFGSVRVEVTVGSSTWQTSVFPDKKAASFVLPVKKPIRTKESLEDGDLLQVHLKLET